MIIYILDMLGVAFFAVTGTLAAGRKQMDAFGIVVIAIVTALGGGTLRDLLLGIRPILWIANPTYLFVATAASLLTFMLARYINLSHNVLLFFDALGLAMYTVIGCERAMSVNAPFAVVVVMGVMTGVAGGVIRDILSGEIPLILRREIYATASLAGAAIFVALRLLHVNPTAAVFSAVVVTLGTRLFAIYKGMSLPVFTYSETDNK